MITAEVTEEQLERWRTLWEARRAELSLDRIGGDDLARYFQEKYHPIICENARILHMLYAGAREHGSTEPSISAYWLDGGILVGIDRKSGWFHVECEEISRAVPVWDDLFVMRGLSAEDLENYVLTGQYLELSEPEIAGRI